MESTLFPLAVIQTGMAVDDHQLIQYLENQKRYWVICLPTVDDFLTLSPKTGQFNRILLHIRQWTDAIPAHIESIHSQYPQSQLVIITKNIKPDQLLRAICAGAVGCIVHNGDMNQLGKDLDALETYGSVISSQVLKPLCLFVQKNKWYLPQNAKMSEAESVSVKVDKVIYPLTMKQKRIMELLAAGETYHSAAGIMGIKIDCFRYHIKKIYSTLNVSSKGAVVRKFMEIEYGRV
jgi:DNA-binding NarL/FixJ family response regulator